MNWSLPVNGQYKLIILLLLIIAILLVGCKRMVVEFSREEVEKAKHFVVSEILPLYPKASSPARYISKEQCDVYRAITSRLNSANTPAPLKWHPPVINLQVYPPVFDYVHVYFLFFVPRPYPVFDFCTDNCLGKEDIPVHVLQYEISGNGKASWREYDMVLWSGKWPYRSENPCELFKKRQFRKSTT